MPNAAPIQALVYREGSAILLARVKNWTAEYITQVAISSIAYTVSLVDADDDNTVTAVTGHDGVAIAKADAAFDTLQKDDLWRVDDTGYNFKHQIDVSDNEAFALLGRRYRIDVVLTPVSGQVIRWAYLVEAV